ncbi:hypothetical protein [Pseudooctadecabacter jejudonensis]|uniref:Uncharacterized protein n=1 Tax=Pseudooctadecabacter jejudonensis TaxID=1391910 RepID=A0A1Y5RHK5_9RHOB|nr:hypothetical protein [Pseudooctadecabacter jejudonensis]SLN16489.1 hypothetical protein PSJ8397_00423 [Pseudooctadecabacter jejudonensis]
MSWTTALTHWPQLLEQLAADFPQLEAAALKRFRGDRDKMEIYLADAHHLTRAEARETLNDWLMYRAPVAASQIAA